MGFFENLFGNDKTERAQEAYDNLVLTMELFKAGLVISITLNNNTYEGLRSRKIIAAFAFGVLQPLTENKLIAKNKDEEAFIIMDIIKTFIKAGGCSPISTRTLTDEDLENDKQFATEIIDWFGRNFQEPLFAELTAMGRISAIKVANGEEWNKSILYELINDDIYNPLVNE